MIKTICPKCKHEFLSDSSIVLHGLDICNNCDNGKVYLVGNYNTCNSQKKVKLEQEECSICGGFGKVSFESCGETFWINCTCKV